MRETTYRTVRYIAESLGIDQSKVLHWIHSGQLAAVDVSERPGGRPRWRISDDAWQAFLAARSNQSRPTPPEPRRRRKRQDASVIQFY